MIQYLINFYVLQLSKAYALYLSSVNKCKQEFLDLLVGCYVFDHENDVLPDDGKVDLLAQVVQTSHDCQNYPNVIEYANKLLTLPISLEIKGHFCSILGLAYSGIGQHSKAVQRHEKHLNISIELGDKEREAGAYNNLGNVYHRIRQYSKALECHEKSLNISIELGDRAGKGRAYCNLGKAYHNIGQYRKALKYFEKYLNASIELENKAKERTAYVNLGDACRSIGHYSKVIEYNEKVLNISIELGNEAGERMAYDNLGNAYDSIGQYRKALEYHEKHQNISKNMRDETGEGVAYANLGFAYSNIQQHNKALEYHEKALNISVKLGDKAREENAYANLGCAYRRIGHFSKALECHQKALNISIELGNKVGEGGAYCNLSNAHRSIGQYTKTLEYCEKYLNIFIELGDKAGKGRAYANIGNTYLSFGQYSKALEYHEKHLNIMIELGDKLGEGMVYANLGSLFNSIGQYSKALEYHEKELNISIELGEKARQEAAYCNLCKAYCSIGQYTKALEYCEKHLNISLELRDKVEERRAYANLGDVYRSMGQFNKALEYREKALNVLKELGDKTGEGNEYWNLGLEYYSLGHYDTSLRYLCQSVLVYDGLRRDFINRDQFNISMANGNLLAYKFSMSCLLNLNQIGKALLVLDVGRAKALPDLMWINKGTVNDSPLRGNCMRWIEKIPQIIDILERDKYADITDNVVHSVTDGSVVVFGFDGSNDLVIWVLTQQKTSFRKWSPTRMSACDFFQKIARNIRNGLVVQDSGLSLEDKRDGSRKRNSKILYQSPDQKNKLSSKADEASEDFAFEEELKSINEIQERSGESQDFQDGIHSEVRSPGTIQRTEAKILRNLLGAYKALLSSVENLLTGSKLILVPEGPLFRLPFSALLGSDGKYLCDHYSVQISPSLHTLNFTLNSPARPLGSALFVGNPTVGIVQFGGIHIEASPLPGAEVEAMECASYFEAQPLLRERATKQNVLNEMKNVSIIHIAAHGNMEYAEIFLAPNAGAPSPATEEHYLLMPDDISKCALSARLVVLSCCHSGRGEISAEGMVGTARSFLGAGARAVLVALWELPDTSTLPFMKLFYQNVCSCSSVCVAVQQATRTFKEQNDDIQAWAPFQIFGEDVVFTSEDLEDICRQSCQ